MTREGGENARFFPNINKEQFTMNDRLWTIRDLATYLNVSVGAVRMMRKRGEIPSACTVKIGRRLRFVPSRIREWIGVEKKRRAAQ